MIKRIKNKFSKDRNLGEMAKHSAHSFGMRVLGLLVNYLFLFFVTRYYGAKGWGIFALCFSMLQIASMIGTLGINVALVKLIPQGYTNLKQIYYQILKFIIPLNLALSIIVFSFSTLIGNFLSADGIRVDAYIRIAALGILPFSISMINSGIFRGNKEIVKFSFYDSLGRFLWGGICVAVLCFFSLNTYNVIIGFVAGLYVLSFISFKGVNKILDKNSLSGTAKPDGALEFTIKNLLELSIPLFWSTFIMQGSTWATTLIIGMFLPKQDVGFFDASNRLASLLTIVLYAINSISAPQFAESAIDKKLLKKSVHSSSKLIFIGTIPLFIIMIFSGPFLMKFLEHNESYGKDVQLIFFIILLSQLINNLSGSVTLLMQMTGYHKLNQNISLFCFIFTTVMLYFITPVYGLIGASLITGLNIILRNIASVVIMYSKINILTVYVPSKKDIQWLRKK